MTESRDLGRYQEQWESYWGETAALEKTTSPDAARSIWDIPPERALALDLPRFRDLIDETLPMVDFGCGKGIQTPALATHFDRVIGTDVAAHAIELAREQHPHPNATYEVLDAFDVASVQRFHARHGDVNLYMRFVIHHIPLEERALFAESITTLLGREGVLFMYELSSSSDQYFQQWIGKNGLPTALARAMKTGAAPGPVDGSLIRHAFPESEYEYLREGESVAETFVDERHTTTAVNAKGGGSMIPWEPPTYFAVIKPRRR